MKLTLSVHYHTNWGESLHISVLGIASDGSNPDIFEMSYSGQGMWIIEIEIPDSTSELQYSYMLRREDGSLKMEWGRPHSLFLGNSSGNVRVIDRWQDMPVDKPYYSSAFTESFLQRKDRDLSVYPAKNMLTMMVQAPMIAPDETVAVVGESEELGAWDPSRAIRMSDASYPLWTVNLPASIVRNTCEYKFIIVKKKSGELVAWEACDNRRVVFDKINEGDTLIDAGQRLANPKQPWHGAGVAIPVFSLRSDEDFGVGDFFDLKLMVDWAARTGQRVIQILPINDTTMTGSWTDSYPYNAITTFALHPMYLRLSEMGMLKDRTRQRYYDELGRQLNGLADVDYENVNRAKREFTGELFTQDGTLVLASDEFKNFFRRNSSWLVPYAAWSVLRDINKTPDMECWGEYAVYDEAAIARFVDEHAYEVDYYYYLQYFLDKQLREVRDYAHSKGVALKGDIPIGISHTSVDAWIEPRLFNLDCQAGAPPDTFSVLGQNWGFPTYNWEEMAKDGFAWWKARFRKMAEYFDAYRIDHVLGFFRIWQIPMDAIHGLLGIFNRALPFTPEELKDDYGFNNDPSQFTKPLITLALIKRYFGDAGDEIISRFFVMESEAIRLKPEFDTQRKIASYFAEQEKNEYNDRLCEGLMMIVDEVLFIEDPYEKGKYHPRISAQSSFVYQSLDEKSRKAFDLLYEDFYWHRMDDFWAERAMWKLPPLIDATDMLVCAEDLGMIPGCVPAVMNKLQILVLEIQRMSKDPSTIFGDTENYPYLSVCTTSSHDMDGIRRWWETDRELTQRYFNEILGENGEAPFYAEPWICERIIKLHLKSPSMLCILPLQDWLSIDGVIRRHDPREELINIPANSRHHWRYRIHISLEDLKRCDELNNRIREMIIFSHR